MKTVTVSIREDDREEVLTIECQAFEMNMTHGYRDTTADLGSYIKRELAETGLDFVFHEPKITVIHNEF
jgi:hypothetical protein